MKKNFKCPVSVAVNVHEEGIPTDMLPSQTYGGDAFVIVAIYTENHDSEMVSAGVIEVRAAGRLTLKQHAAALITHATHVKAKLQADPNAVDIPLGRAVDAFLETVYADAKPSAKRMSRISYGPDGEELRHDDLPLLSEILASGEEPKSAFSIPQGVRMDPPWLHDHQWETMGLIQWAETFLKRAASLADGLTPEAMFADTAQTIFRLMSDLGLTAHILDGTAQFEAFINAYAQMLPDFVQEVCGPKGDEMLRLYALVMEIYGNNPHTLELGPGNMLANPSVLWSLVYDVRKWRQAVDRGIIVENKLRLLN